MVTSGEKCHAVKGASSSVTLGPGLRPAVTFQPVNLGCIARVAVGAIENVPFVSECSINGTYYSDHWYF